VFNGNIDGNIEKRNINAFCWTHKYIMMFDLNKRPVVTFF
jgi:hypothetical protein